MDEPAQIFPLQVIIHEFPGGDNLQPFVPRSLQKVFVARDDNTGSALQRTRQELIIVGIFANRDR